ncbi:MAG: isopeptide-forming domain-containing fimbrial protein [Lachnospiraceae bacterium]|nr:isopeptide-forming domain-containing fimbrial protein [Lachnospiraceae bacterium]
MKHKDRFVFGRTARSVLRTMLSVVLLLCSILFLPGVTVDVSAQSLTADTNKIVTSKAEITVTNVPEGKSISWPTYQVLYATYDAGSNALEYHLTDWAQDVLVGTGTTGTGTTGTTEEAAIKEITKLTTTGAVATEQSDLVNQLAAATAKTEYTAASWSVTGTTAKADLPVGAYLVIPSCEEMTFLNMLVSVDTSETTETDEDRWVLTAKGAVLKGKSLSIDKKITGKNGSAPVAISAGKTTETAQIGDTIHYTIEAQVPHYPDNSAVKTFKVVDTPTNLSISTESISVSGVKTGGGETPIAAASYAVSKNTTDGSVTIDFSNHYDGTFYDTATKSWPYVSVKITYTAVVTEDANMGAEGNPNTAKLIYQIDNQEKELPSPKTTVFTYGLNVVKLEAGTEGKKLTNAVFQISRDVNGTSTPLYFKDNEDGSYTLAQDQAAAASATGYTKDLKTQGTDGSFWLKGLDAGVDYSLKEVKAPSGYSVNTDTLTIRLTAKTNPDDSTYTGILQGVTGKEKDKTGLEIAPGTGSWTFGVLDTEKAKAAVSLTDTKLFELPATGGKGTDGFARNGILLLTAAALVYGISRRKKQDERG